MSAKATPPVVVPTLLLTLDQAAEACQVGRPKLDEWTHRAGFPVIRDGGTVRVPLALLKLWLEDEAKRTNQKVPDDTAWMSQRLYPPARRRG